MPPFGVVSMRAAHGGSKTQWPSMNVLGMPFYLLSFPSAVHIHMMNIFAACWSQLFFFRGTVDSRRCRHGCCRLMQTDPLWSSAFFSRPSLCLGPSRAIRQLSASLQKWWVSLWKTPAEPPNEKTPKNRHAHFHQKKNEPRLCSCGVLFSVSDNFVPESFQPRLPRPSGTSWWMTVLQGVNWAPLLMDPVGSVPFPLQHQSRAPPGAKAAVKLEWEPLTPCILLKKTLAGVL